MEEIKEMLKVVLMFVGLSLALSSVMIAISKVIDAVVGD